ncbi:MAG TPA: hypothetical protein VND65_18125 [Candidatus Binatia bacterium]|nr:hypothetical protein [Candidatus Binatia bacterium]
MRLNEIMRNFVFFRPKDRAVFEGRFVGRRRTHDAVFQYRMGAGMQGAVNRSHPVTIEPCMIDTSSSGSLEPQFYGSAVVADGASPNGVRVPISSDAAAAIYGFAVRPFPLQPTTGGLTTSFGTVVPPPTQPLDVMRSGYMIVKLQGVAPAFKGSLVQVCIVAGTGYLVGGVSVDTVSGTFVQLDQKSSFNGPADPNGLVELAFNI